MPPLPPVEVLTRINLDDLFSSFGWENSRLARLAAGWIFRSPARRFARRMISFDQDVARHGLRAGAARLLPAFSDGLIVQGQEHLPQSGALLIAANHPGMADTLALFASIPRANLRIIGNDRPFLRALPAISEHMIFVPPAEPARMAVVRETLQVLRAGGAVLTFPAGHIEPDPAVLPGAVASLASWSESLALFTRRIPELTVCGAVVSHVLAPQATFHPLTRLRRAQLDRERLGASLQLLAVLLLPAMWRLTTHVTFTPPLRAAELAALRTPQAITQAVTDAIRPYLEAAQDR